MSTETSHPAAESLPDPAAVPPMSRLVPAIFLSSLGSVLFSLLIFRLLSFFIMPSMFFSLLLVGFPIGAALVARQGESNANRFRLLLTVLEGVMVVSLLATLLAKHVNYLRAHLLFGVDPNGLLLQVLIFALLYLPFFIAYGAAEYVGYLTGTRAFGQRLRPVYGLFLLGGAAAFALAECLQRPLGVPRLLVIAIALVSVGRLFLPDRPKACPSVLRRYKTLPELAVLAALVFWPAFDRTFMNGFKSSADVALSAAYYLKEPGTAVAFAGWGKYAYVEILQKPLPANPFQVKNMYVGLYNDLNMWWYYPMVAMPAGGLALPPQMLLGERVPFLFSPGPSGKVALLGSGGGREVILARVAKSGRILAVEIEPAVVDAIQGPLADAFNEVYTKAPVEVYVGEARGYFEHSREHFDLIMLMSVGGYPQLMLEPGNMIRTAEAFRIFASRLTPQGVLAIGYSGLLDNEAVLLRQYYQTLRQQGMEAHAYTSPVGEYLLLANRPDAPMEQKAKWEKARRQLEAGGAIRIREGDLALHGFRAITDDRPYLAGNLSNVLSPAQIGEMALTLSALIGLVGLLLAWYLPRQLVRQHCPVEPAALLGMAFLVGVNFMVIEQLCVIQLFRRLYTYYDSLIIGIVAFLTLTGLGSLLAPKGKLLAPLLAATVLLALVWWAGSGEGGNPSSLWEVLPALALLLPAVLATGTFFPLLFEQVPMARLALFAMDAMGAAAGGLLGFFVPMLFGFQAFTGVAMATYLLTALGMLLFLNRIKSPAHSAGNAQ